MWRNNLANMAAAADILENLGDDREEEEEDGEPSNFQAWYVRSANNIRSRDRSEARLEQEAESESGDQEMEDGLEEELETRERLEVAEPEFERPQERFLGHMFRSLSIDTAEAAPVEAVAVGGPGPALASLPSNHNPFLGEPGPGNSGNGNFGGGAIPRRNSGYVRNVNQGPGTLYNWQATKTTVNERFAFMFNNEILADVHFKVNERECIVLCLHKIISGWSRRIRAEDSCSQVRALSRLRCV